MNVASIPFAWGKRSQVRSLVLNEPEFVFALFPKSDVPDWEVFVFEPNKELPVFPNPPELPNPPDPNPDF